MMVGVIVSNIFIIYSNIHWGLSSWKNWNELEWVPVAHLLYVLFPVSIARFWRETEVMEIHSAPWLGAQTQCCGWRCSLIWPNMMKHVPSFGLQYNDYTVWIGIQSIFLWGFLSQRSQFELSSRAACKGSGVSQLAPILRSCRCCHRWRMMRLPRHSFMNSAWACLGCSRSGNSGQDAYCGDPGSNKPVVVVIQIIRRGWFGCVWK